MSIGKNIKALRESHGLTQAEFAKKIGVSDKTVSAWELEERTPRMGPVEKICKEFGLVKSQLYEGENESGMQADVRFNKAFMEATKREDLKIFFTQVAEMSEEDFEKARKVIEAFVGSPKKNDEE